MSCFDVDSNCQNWTTDFVDLDQYQCYYGTVAVDLSECNIYGTLFNPDDVSSGYAYANPATGEKADGQTTASDTDVVATALLSKDWLTGGHYTAVDVLDRKAAAYAIAAACVGYIEKQNDLLFIKLDPKEECTQTPVYSPGNDIPTATAHDIAAIASGYPFSLHYENEDQKVAGTSSAPPVLRGWYRPVAANCAGASYPRSDTVNHTHCDEYPYYSTTEGGPGASLVNIPAGDNTTQGFQLGEFYASTGCDLTPSPTPGEDNLYLVVPDPGPFPSIAICS